MSMPLSRFVATSAPAEELPLHCTTIEAAKRLGLAVRSVQMMVDRGELHAWKTVGGHRRIAVASVEAWIRERQQPSDPSHSVAGRKRGEALAGRTRPQPAPPVAERAPTVLVIEDSIHYQKMLSLLIEQRFPDVDLHLAGDGVSGLAMCGVLRPQVLIVDILLPGIDGATLITTLRSHDQFVGCELIVVTSLDEGQLEPYAFALEGVPVVHKTRLVTDLPVTLQSSLEPRTQTPAWCNVR